MYVTLYGAACEVTGSCYLVETEQSRLLVDCGLYQGPERLTKLNRIPKKLLSSPLDAVVLTHGHLDHCGRLPLLVKAGYSGPIFATEETIDIAKLILNDAVRIQQGDIERENRHRQRDGLKPVSPLFDQHDVERVCRLFKTIDYEKSMSPAAGVQIELVEAGHILGSASVKMFVSQSERTVKLVFSGDIGPWNAAIMRDPTLIQEADVTFVESTYGDRDHRSLADTVTEFQTTIKTAIEKKGKVLIPTFAVGRTQQILYHLAEIFRQSPLEPCPIFLDSPMAIAATELYRKHPELMDEEAQNLENTGQLRRDLRSLKLCPTADDSRALNNVAGPCVILAGAGMCNAGRILHHLRQNLGSPDTVVIIVGYQAKGSLGRQLVEGAETVRIFGETVPVRATVKGLGGFSAHAGQSDLLKWLQPMASKGARIMLTHGEPEAMNELGKKIRERFNIESECPGLGEELSI
jgi:metallo-beta-lactamase family protein